MPLDNIYNNGRNIVKSFQNVGIWEIIQLVDEFQSKYEKNYSQLYTRSYATLNKLAKNVFARTQISIFFFVSPI